MTRTSEYEAASTATDVAEPGEVATDAASTEAGRERLMSDYSIVHRGRWYLYGGYRYDRLADAVDYAVLMRSRPSRRPTGDALTQADDEPLPDASDLRLMAELGISLEGGVYRFETFRYDHLADAVNYARQRIPKAR
jgi:hypothetical protein